MFFGQRCSSSQHGDHSTGFKEEQEEEEEEEEKPILHNCEICLTTYTETWHMHLEHARACMHVSMHCIQTYTFAP
jgi:hypothetical protein